MKKTLKRLFALLLAAAMLMGFVACGKDGAADVTGKYNCIAVAADGKNFYAPENENAYVELKKGGKGVVSDGLNFDIQWQLEGENFSGSYGIFGISVPLIGTLKDGVLEIQDDGVVTRYLKTGMEMPDWAGNLEAVPNDTGRLAGLYTLYAMEVAGVRYDYAALVEMDMMDSSYLRIDYDAAAGYTGELSFEGEEPDTFTLEYELGILNFAGGDQMGFYEEAPGVIGITHADLGGTIFFALDSVDRSAGANPDAASAETEDETDPLLAWRNGNWYGWWFMYGCKGKFADLEGEYWDCEARIEISSDYTGTMEMWDDDMPRTTGGIGSVHVSLSDNGVGEHGTLMSEGGWFMEKNLAHADWIIDPALSGFENMLVITGDYDDDNGNVYYYKLMLRPWG